MPSVPTGPGEPPRDHARHSDDPGSLGSGTNDDALSGPDVTIAVAQLLRPQGRKGELLAECLSDLPGLFVTGRHFDLGRRGVTRPVILEDCWRPQGRNAGRLVLKLAGIDSISSAESVQQQQLFLSEALLPAREEGTYLVRDLIGCLIFDGASCVGTVVDLQFPIGPDGHTRLADAADLLAVRRESDPPDAEPLLIPFVKAWLVEVNLSAQKITMHLPPGLSASNQT